MRTFLIENDDLVFDNQGEVLMVEGELEEVQSAERIMTANKKEFFLDPDHGFDHALLKTKKLEKNLIRMGLAEAITQDSRFKGIRDLNISSDNSLRTMAANYKIVKKTGDVLESEVKI